MGLGHVGCSGCPVHGRYTLFFSRPRGAYEGGQVSRMAGAGGEHGLGGRSGQAGRAGPMKRKGRVGGRMVSGQARADDG